MPIIGTATNDGWYLIEADYGLEFREVQKDGDTETTQQQRKFLSVQMEKIHCGNVTGWNNEVGDDVSEVTVKLADGQAITTGEAFYMVVEGNTFRPGERGSDTLTETQSLRLFWPWEDVVVPDEVPAVTTTAA